MGVHWKSKQTQRNLLSKSTLAHHSSNMSPCLQCISIEGLYPSTWNYDNLVGTIWMPEPQGYDVRSGGSIPIEVRDPYGTSPAGDLNGGSYDNR